MMVADVDDNTAKATTGFGGPKTPDLDQPECQWPKRLMCELVRIRLLNLVSLVTQPLAIEATDQGPAAIVPALPRAP
jgi:hypothetical protein